LCRVSEASGYTATGSGTDPLISGRIRLVGQRNNADDDRIAVVLRGATPNVTYGVWFRPHNGGEESLGSVGPTNSVGNLADVTDTALSGARRVGVFVIRRDGIDQFVSCLGD
jgi:hypothetical protein